MRTGSEAPAQRCRSGRGRKSLDATFDPVRLDDVRFALLVLVVLLLTKLLLVLLLMMLLLLLLLRILMVHGFVAVLVLMGVSVESVRGVGSRTMPVHSSDGRMGSRSSGRISGEKRSAGVQEG